MGMIGGDGVAKILTGEMGVDLGGGKAFVAQHFLHGAQIGTILHQLGGKAMAEAVG